MSDTVFSRVPAATAAEVCRRFPLGREATTLLRDDLTPDQFLGLLVERRLFRDATNFLAFALPNREAVWWAILCAREVAGVFDARSKEAHRLDHFREVGIIELCAVRQPAAGLHLQFHEAE